MYIDKIIKREALVLVISVIVLLTVFFGISYSYFMSFDKGEDNVISVGDLKVTFCTDETCQKDYANFGQVIGTKSVNGQSVANSIYPFETDEKALKEMPYIFNIKNTGTLNSYITIKLKEDSDYIPNELYQEYGSATELYSNNIKVGISNCDNGINTTDVKIMTYGELENNIILTDELLESLKDRTYCLWTWLDKDTPNEVQNTYFVANLDFKAEYKPISE